MHARRILRSCPTRRSSDLTKPEQNVVNENHRQTDHEARELAVAPVAGAEREADETEYEAGERNRKLLLDFEELGVWINPLLDRKSTRLNSSHLGISYAVFC